MFRLPGRPPHHRLTTVQQPRPWHPAHTHSQKKLNSRAHTTPKKRASAFGGGRHPKKVGKWVEGRFREGECDSRPGNFFLHRKAQKLCKNVPKKCTKIQKKCAKNANHVLLPREIGTQKQKPQANPLFSNLFGSFHRPLSALGVQKASESLNVTFRKTCLVKAYHFPPI